MIRKTLAILLLANTLALAACNTIRGAGRDVESVANTVDKAT
jgi:predicted small secreted protein